MVLVSKQDKDLNISQSTLNKLRASVLGANDGIISTAAVVMGVSGATSNRETIFMAGMAALVAGALSMAVGEYVSVSSQRDAEKLRAKKKKVEEHKDDISSPSHAAIASFLAFTAGGLVPFLAVILAPASGHVMVTIVAVTVALLLTGYFSANTSGTSHKRAMIRILIGGFLAMGLTYLVGMAFGQSAVV